MRRYHFDWATTVKAASGKLPAGDEEMNRKLVSMIRDYWAKHDAYPEVTTVFRPGRTERENGVWAVTSNMVNGLPQEFQS